MKRCVWVSALLVLAVALAVSGQADLSGAFSHWTEVDLVAGQFDSFDLEIDVTYSLGRLELTSDTVLLHPTMWVWQEFVGAWAPGWIDMTGSILFSGSTAAQLYSEWIASFALGGLFIEMHGAFLGSSVVGGPADGWAVCASGSAGRIDVTSVTEFGAHIEDASFAGISIVHAITGSERHYSTDPRVVGGPGFTGQKIQLTMEEGFCCADVNAEVYFNCDGFSYASFAALGISTPKLPWLRLDADLLFELDEKTLAVAPYLVLGDISCVTLYGELKIPSMGTISSFRFPALELVCRLGPVTFREVAIFDLNEMVLTTEAYGSRLLDTQDAIANGWSYYADYWEMLSLAYAGPACCEGEYDVLINLYFGEASANLFDWAMTHVEAHLPFTDRLALAFVWRVTDSGTESLSFGVDFEW